MMNKAGLKSDFQAPFERYLESSLKSSLRCGAPKIFTLLSLGTRLYLCFGLVDSTCVRSCPQLRFPSSGVARITMGETSRNLNGLAKSVDANALRHHPTGYAPASKQVNCWLNSSTFNSEQSTAKAHYSCQHQALLAPNACHIP